MTTKRIPIIVDSDFHKRVRIKSAKAGKGISSSVRAFLRAWVKDDPRAQQIVDTYGTIKTNRSHS